MGAGEIVNAAGGRSARDGERRAAPAAVGDDVAAHRDGGHADDDRLGHARSSGARARRTASSSAGSSRTPTCPRPQAALLLGMVANAGICQISNDDYTASCSMPRAVLAPYLRSR